LLIDLLLTGLYKGMISVLRLAKVVIPSTIFVVLLQTLGILQPIGDIFAPLMKIVGLPGQAAVAFAIGIFASIYAGIGAMAALSLTVKEATILSAMIAMCHSAFMETAVITEAGGSGLLIFTLRFIGAVLVGGLIHIFWM
jgi:hypothetical protein